MAGVEWNLLEREVECAAVAGAVRAVVRGRGGLLLVEGAAGVGKSRLLTEAQAAAVEAGAGVVWARGSELERDFAFGVVRQLFFEPLLADTGAVGRDALWAGPAAQAREVFTTADATTGPAGDFAVLHGLYWLTVNACQERALVLLVDDLQWCDAPSLRYLAYLLPRIEDLALLVVAGLRTGEVATDERLLQQITTDLVVQVLQPQALSARASALLLRQVLPGGVDEDFAAACHEAAGGNPLLLRELARTLIAEGLAASTENAGRVTDLGPQAVAELVAARLAHLPQACVALARAVAVLGDRTDLTTAAAVAGQDTTAALKSTAALERVEILRPTADGRALSFAHPLVQTAVYHSADLAQRTKAHRLAARLLTAAGAAPERISAHLLHVPAADDPKAAAVLRAAATKAVQRGSPDSAYIYLRRCLDEPPADNQRLHVLLEAGQAALLGVDVATASSLLQQAFDQLTDPAQRADIAIALGTTHLWMLDPGRACAVWSDVLDRLSGTEQDRRRRLMAALLDAAFVTSERGDTLKSLADWRRLPVDESLGGRLLDCAISCLDMAACDPGAAARAHSALADGSVVEQAPGDGALILGWLVLLAADDSTVMDSLHLAVERGHLHGSLYGLTPAYAFRALGWLWRGQLAEAEHDARESQRLAQLGHYHINQLFGSVYLANALMEQGRLDEADAVLQSIGAITSLTPGPVYFALDSRARLLWLRGDYQEALDSACQAGQVWESYGVTNPAFGSWRSEAALALHSLCRSSEARQIAAEELALARRWGAPRALGRALRITGLLYGGAEGLKVLEEAVTVLEDSPARLEYTKALTDLGAALRRAGHSRDARPPLRLALDLATRCGATSLADRARTELAAAGGRPRRTELTGLDALTPSERRIAELAAGGATNRQIAQDLYVTPKTIEVHLSAVYRKLAITTRTQLPQIFTAT